MHKLAKHKNEQVAKLALDICDTWKTFIKHHHNRPVIEVRSDLKTQKLRGSGKKLIAECLDVLVKIFFALNYVEC